VSFTISWSAGYPGPAVCRFQLFDENSEEVGSQDVEIDSLTPSLSAPAPIAIPVSSPPASGRAECSAGAPGVGVYTLSAVGSPTEVDASSATILVRAQWSEKGDPGTNSCIGMAETTQGETSSDPFTVDVGDGDVFPVELPVPAGSVLGVTFTCIPFGESVQATQGVDAR